MSCQLNPPALAIHWHLLLCKRVERATCRPSPLSIAPCRLKGYPLWRVTCASWLTDYLSALRVCFEGLHSVGIQTGCGLHDCQEAVSLADLMAT
eukprot:scaffold26938_cov19-Tisochrysis_lutea.AAC.1